MSRNSNPLRRRKPLLRRDVYATAPFGWVATPGFWHVRDNADDPLATRCGLNLRDGLTNREPPPDEAVCRRCV